MREVIDRPPTKGSIVVQCAATRAWKVRERLHNSPDLSRIIGVKLEDHLTEEQKAVSRAFEHLAHTSLFASHRLFRLENVSQFAELLPPNIFGLFHPFVVQFFKRSYVSSTASMLTWTGIGKHSRDEQIGIGSDDIRAISNFLGTKHYFCGFKPTRIDAAMFAVLAQIVYAPFDNEHLEIVKRECPNIMEYVERIKNRYWPDWGDATTKFTMDSNWRKRPKGYVPSTGTGSNGSPTAKKNTE
ncbi:unnamed protein product [Nippostrongylus brasiliensis]|uniref:Failed axon connections homolog (inferred by orthology to a human protein) n=1 Tax=Nippostrongylus brasiliensis TaxID=27835 RepID=A0A0N4YFG9_NIPBR|nr:unnamed protein product [Nippostrongylus brasiliensis]